jgi:flagellar hook-length control protein FliK
MAPVVNRPPQTDAAPVESVTGGGAKDFAGTLSAVTGKAPRKTEQTNGADSRPGGDSLPAPGSLSPPAAAPLSSATPAAATAPTAATAPAAPVPAGVPAAGEGRSASASAALADADPSNPAAGDDPADAGVQVDTATPLAASLGAAQDASAATAPLQMAVLTAAGTVSSKPAGSVPGRLASSPPLGSKSTGPPVAAPGPPSADTGDANNTQGPRGSLPGDSPAAAAGLQSTNAAAVDVAPAAASDTAVLAASKLQAAADEPAATATVGQNPALASIAASIESPSVTSTPATPTPAIVDPATIANGSAGDKHAHENADAGLGGTGNGDGTAAAQQLVSNASPASSTAAGSIPMLKVSAALDSANFPQGLAERVSWVVDNNLNGAKLQVNPPQLGPIELQIAVQGDHAQVWMSTHSAVAREALESSVPKLREMLGAQGFGEVRVDISQRSFQERSTYAPPYEWVAPAARTAASGTSPANAVARTSLGALDAYA